VIIEQVANKSTEDIKVEVGVPTKSWAEIMSEEKIDEDERRQEYRKEKKMAKKMAKKGGVETDQ